MRPSSKIWHRCVMSWRSVTSMNKLSPPLFFLSLCITMFVFESSQQNSAQPVKRAFHKLQRDNFVLFATQSVAAKLVFRQTPICLTHTSSPSVLNISVTSLSLSLSLSHPLHSQVSLRLADGSSTVAQGLFTRPGKQTRNFERHIIRNTSSIIQAFKQTGQNHSADWAKSTKRQCMLFLR